MCEPHNLQVLLRVVGLLLAVMWPLSVADADQDSAALELVNSMICKDQSLHSYCSRVHLWKEQSEVSILVLTESEAVATAEEFTSRFTELQTIGYLKVNVCIFHLEEISHEAPEERGCGVGTNVIVALFAKTSSNALLFLSHIGQLISIEDGNRAAALTAAREQMIQRQRAIISTGASCSYDGGGDQAGNLEFFLLVNSQSGYELPFDQCTELLFLRAIGLTQINSSSAQRLTRLNSQALVRALYLSGIKSGDSYDQVLARITELMSEQQ